MGERKSNSSETSEGLVERAKAACLAINPKSSLVEVIDVSTLLSTLRPEDKKRILYEVENDRT